MSKNSEKWIGILFIIAAISSMIGLSLYSPLLREDNYLQEGSGYTSQVILGAILELILVISAVGTSILFFPYLKKYDVRFAMGYFCFRLLEVVFIMMGIIAVLGLLSLSVFASAHPEFSDESLQISGQLLKKIHAWTFILGPNFMLAINTFIYSFFLVVSKAVPRVISSLGIAAAILIGIAALLELFGVIDQISVWGIALALPIFVYEMSLAFWLIVKGLNPIKESKQI